MGYTHYFNFSRAKVADIENGDKKFKKAVALFKKGLAMLPDIKLGDGLGKGEPIITDERLCFNGKGDEAYETFNVVLNKPMESWDKFCKTARMPYDVAVCLALLCFSKAFGNDFSYRSDGNKDDDGWKQAHAIMNKLKT